MSHGSRDHNAGTTGVFRDQRAETRMPHADSADSPPERATPESQTPLPTMSNSRQTVPAQIIQAAVTHSSRVQDPSGYQQGLATRYGDPSAVPSAQAQRSGTFGASDRSPAPTERRGTRVPHHVDDHRDVTPVRQAMPEMALPAARTGGLSLAALKPRANPTMTSGGGLEHNNSLVSLNEDDLNAYRSAPPPNQPRPQARFARVADEVGHEEYPTQLEMQPGNYSDHASSDGDNDNEFLHVSKSSGSSSQGTNDTAVAGALKSALPCGLTMTVLMAALIAIPIIFLIVFTAIPLSAAVQAQVLLTDQTPFIIACLDAGHRLADERRDSSREPLFKFNDTTNATALVRANLKASRTFIDSQFDIMIRESQSSDLANNDDVIALVLNQTRSLLLFRQKVDDHTVNGPEIRTFYLAFIDSVYSFLNLIGKDPRANLIDKRLSTFALIRRMQNSAGQMRVGCTGLIVNDGYDAINTELIRNMVSSWNRDLAFVGDSGFPEVETFIDKLQNFANYTTLFNLAIRIANAPNYTVRFNTIYTGSNFTIIADGFNDFLDTEDRNVLAVLISGELLQPDVIATSVKMSISVLVCIFAAALVIYFNQKEVERMELTLERTRNLARAVQRFVPKNQLKMMGVRSITEVEAGLQVEVAQTMLFSDIRDFTTLSEKMQGGELFDWLQAYVSRMNKCTASENGYISNYIGDALFCVFNQARNGVQAAVGIHVSTDQLNLELVAGGSRNPVQIGVGLHFGVVVAGVFGDDTRLATTMVASDVNLASRLEGLTKSFGSKIIASDAVADQLDRTSFVARRLGNVMVSGSRKTVAIFDVYATDPLPLREYKEETKAQFERAVALIDTDEEAAMLEFDSLAIIAERHGVKDGAIKRFRSARGNDLQSRRDSGGTPPGTPTALSFEKNGELKGRVESCIFDSSRGA